MKNLFTLLFVTFAFQFCQAQTEFNFFDVLSVKDSTFISSGYHYSKWEIKADTIVGTVNGNQTRYVKQELLTGINEEYDISHYKTISASNGRAYTITIYRLRDCKDPQAVTMNTENYIITYFNINK